MTRPSTTASRTIAVRSGIESDAAFDPEALPPGMPRP